MCELDLVYDFYKVFALLDEFFLGGEIQETSSKVILNRMMVLEEYERKSIKDESFAYRQPLRIACRMPKILRVGCERYSVQFFKNRF